MYRRALSIILALALLIVPLAGEGSAMAASVSSGNGIRLSPIRYDLTINPGQSQRVQFRIDNVTKAPAVYKAIVTDFTANNQNGSPQLIVTGSQFDPHSIKQFITPIPNFTVNPNQTATIYVTITIPSGTAGGGYYGAIRFLAANGGSDRTVNISSSVAGLILIKVPGPAMKESLLLSNFAVGINGQIGSLFYGNKGIDAIVQFQNNGNVQIEPFGQIIVKNISGDKIDTTAINNVNPPGNVLPGSSRLFSVPISGIGSFGKYTVAGYFGYGSKGQLLSATTTFYVVAPWIIILLVVLVILVVVSAFLMPRIFRAWYKRSIRKAH